MLDIEIGGAAILIEIPCIKRAALGIRSNVQNLAVGVRTHHHETAGKAFGHLDLQRIVGGPAAALDL